MRVVIEKEIVINRCYGGYRLSRAAAQALADIKGIKTAVVDGDYLVVDDGTFRSVCDAVERTDPDLIRIVREMGKAANGECSQLSIHKLYVEIEIDSRDGYEDVHVGGYVS